MADEEGMKIVLQGTKLELMQRIPAIMDAYQIFKAFDERGLYTIPVTTFQDTWTFHPQVKLFFGQQAHETRDGFPRVTGEISYRVMGETSETFTPANARVRAQRIKQLFAEPELFVWQKGKLRVSYADQANGYQFQLLVKNESEARKIITRVMEIEGKTPTWDKLTLHESKKTFPDTTATVRIYAEQRKLPRRRPREDIRFRYAELHLWGRPKPVALVDTLGKLEQPIVTRLLQE